MNRYDNDLLKFINYLNNERQNTKNIMISLEILAYRQRNNTPNLEHFIKPLKNILTEEEIKTILQSKSNEPITNHMQNLQQRLSSIDNILKKLDNKTSQEDYIKKEEFIFLLTESNLSTEEKARVMYQINCLNIPIMENILAQKERLRINIKKQQDTLRNLISTSTNLLKIIQTNFDKIYLNEILGTVISSYTKYLKVEIQKATSLLNNQNITKKEDLQNMTNYLNIEIYSIQDLLNSLELLTNRILKEKSQYKIVYLLEDNHINKEELELLNELKQGKLYNDKLIEGTNSLNSKIYIKTKNNISLSYLKIKSFIIILTITNTNDITKNTLDIYHQYYVKLNEIIYTILTTPLVLLRETNESERLNTKERGK